MPKTYKGNDVRSAGKGYGDMNPGYARGIYSSKSTQSPAPVPMKGSQLNLSSPVQGRDAAKVKSMAKVESKREDLRGMAS